MCRKLIYLSIYSDIDMDIDVYVNIYIYVSLSLALSLCVDRQTELLLKSLLILTSLLVFTVLTVYPVSLGHHVHTTRCRWFLWPGTAAYLRPRKVPEAWKRTTCQLNCHRAAAQPMPEKSSRGSHYTVTVPGKRVGHWGPLAMLQSLMPSICLNGFLNPSPPFHSSPRQTVFRLLSLPVINPFISKRFDQCCLEREPSCHGNSMGKTCSLVIQRWPCWSYAENETMDPIQM